MKQLTNLKKLAAMTSNMKSEDKMDIFIGTVIALNTNADGTGDFTCQVQGETDRSIKTGIPGQNDSANNPTYDNNNSTAIYPNVSFMCGIDEGIFMVPKIGSQVVVCKSLFHQPFIIQMSGVETWNLSIKNSNNEDNGVTINKDFASLVSGNWDTKKSSSSIYVSTQNDLPSITATNVTQKDGVIASIDLNGNDIILNDNKNHNQIQIVNDKISLSHHSGVLVELVDGKISIKNSVNGISLNSILNGFADKLNSATAGGYPIIFPTDPTLINLKLQINQLFN